MCGTEILYQHELERIKTMMVKSEPKSAIIREVDKLFKELESSEEATTIAMSFPLFANPFVFRNLDVALYYARNLREIEDVRASLEEAVVQWANRLSKE